MQKFLIFIILFCFSNSLLAFVKFKSRVGSCPSKTSSDFALTVSNVFDQTHSLRKVKEKIKELNVSQTYFLGSYQVLYAPVKNELMIEVNCPPPIGKLQMQKEDGEYYLATLVEGGEIYPPGYETLLRSEKKLKRSLPVITLPIDELQKPLPKRMAGLILESKDVVRENLAELVVDKEGEMMVVLSRQGHPTTVFFGTEGFDEKLAKLAEILDYMDEHQKYPSVINISNVKKVVVKFGRKF